MASWSRGSSRPRQYSRLGGSGMFSRGGGYSGSSRGRMWTSGRRQSASSVSASFSWRARAILSASLGPTFGDAPQLGHARREHAPGRTEPHRQGPRGLRTYPRHHRQPDQVEQLVFRSFVSVKRGSLARIDIVVPLRASPEHGPDVGLARGVGQLDAADRARQDEADAAAAVLLVPAHGLEQPAGVEPRRRRRQTQPPEQAFDAIDRLGPDPAQPLRKSGFGEHAHGDRLPVLIGPVVTGHRLDGMADGMPEIEHGAKAGLLSLVPLDHRRLEPAAPSDDPPQRPIVPPSIDAACPSSSSKNSPSRMTPYFTTSASPHRSSRSGSVRSVSVSIQTPIGWWNAPMMFLAPG